MKFWRDLLNKRWAAYSVGACSGVLLFWLLNHISVGFSALSSIYAIARPVVMGAIIAYVLNPLVELCQTKVYKKIAHRPKISRNLAVFTTLVAVLALVILLMVALIPQIINSMVSFKNNFSEYATSFENWIDKIVSNKHGVGALFKNSDMTWKEQLSELLNKASSQLVNAENVNSIIGTSYSVGKGFGNFAIACILAIYFLLDAPRIFELTKKFVHVCTTEKKYKEIAEFGSRCNKILVRFIVCDIIEGIIVGLVNFVFMVIFRMDYAVMISVVVGITNTAPTFGPIVGAVIGALILVLVNPLWAAWFLIFTIILQTVDGYIIKPKLFGDTLGISSLLILIAIVVGGRMFGVVGIILGIPVAAIFDYIFKEIIWKKMEYWKALRDETEEKEMEESEKIESEESEV